MIITLLVITIESLETEIIYRSIAFIIIRKLEISIWLLQNVIRLVDSLLEIRTKENR